MKKTLKALLAVVIAAVIFCAGGFVIYKVMVPSEKPDEDVVLTVQNLQIDTSQENISKGVDQLADRQVFFAGIQDGAIAKESPLLLKNPESNEDIYLQYTITDAATGDVVFETDLIEAGKAVEWIPGSVLEPGEYNLNFTEQPYYQVETDKWLPLTTGNNNVTIQVLS